MTDKTETVLDQPAIDPSVMLVDGNYFLHRVLHLPAFQDLQTLDGKMTGGVYGVIRTIHTALRKFPSCGQCFVCWDGGRSRRREHIFPDYKKNRDPSPDASIEEQQEKKQYTNSFESQKQELQRGLGFLGIRQFELPDREADDLLGWATLNLPGAKMIVTEDRDLLQLVYEYCSVYQPMKEIVVTEYNFQKVTGVPRELFVLSKAIVGDKSDNIPGVPRVGDTIAKRIMQKVVSIWDRKARLGDVLTQACVEHQEVDTRNRSRYKSIIENIETVVRRNIHLISIREEMATFTTEEAVTLKELADVPCFFNQIGALGWLGELEFQSIINDFGLFTERFGVLR